MDESLCVSGAFVCALERERQRETEREIRRSKAKDTIVVRD